MLVVQGREEVATRLREWRVVGCAAAGQILVWTRSKNARRRVKVGQKSRGSLLSYDERRSLFKPSELPSRARVVQGQGGYLELLGGGSSRG